jgi:hypothetical protein
MSVLAPKAVKILTLATEEDDRACLFVDLDLSLDLVRDGGSELG